MSSQPQPRVYTRVITASQAEALRQLLTARGWSFHEKDYTLFEARHGKTVVTVYSKGPKVVVQGREAPEFIEFVLEPEILGVAELGYEEVSNPAMFEPHFGIDESGKGDFFGPLVIAGVYTDASIARALLNAGIQDSKAVSSDARIRALADAIRNTPGADFEIVSLGPERYNHLYGESGNLNRLLAWGHSQVIERLLARRPDCPRALSDQFAHERVLQNALGPAGRRITLEQRTKGESDIAVAAASILARERFLNWMKEASSRLGFTLPRGATSVKAVATRLLNERGPDFLPKVCKMHFATAREVLGLPPLPKRQWTGRSKG